MQSLDHIVETLIDPIGHFVLPGWGILSVHRRSSQIGFGRGKIRPPFDELHFVEEQSLRAEHLQSELEKIEFAQPVDVESLALDIERICQEAKNGGELSLGSLGLLELKSDGILFHQAEGKHWSSLYGLPDIDLPSPVAASEQPPKEKQPVAVESKGRNRPLPWLLAAASLALLLLAGSMWYFDVLEGEPYSQILNPPAERVNVKPEDLGAKKVVPMADTQSNNSPFEIAGRNFPQKSTASEDTIASDNPEQSMPESSREEGEEEAQGEGLHYFGSAEQPEAETGSSERGEQATCVIIVGAFKSPSNIAEMKSQLESGGKEVFTGKKGYLTRVGYYSPCDREQLLSNLRKTRSELAPSAWILNE